MADEFNTLNNMSGGSQEQNYTADSNTTVNDTAADNTVNASADNQTADSTATANTVNDGTAQTNGNSYSNSYTTNTAGMNNTAYNGYYGQQNGTNYTQNNNSANYNQNSNGAYNTYGGAYNNNYSYNGYQNSGNQSYNYGYSANYNQSNGNAQSNTYVASTDSNADTKKKKSGGKVGFAVGIISAALLVGGLAGFGGTLIGSQLGIMTSVSGEADNNSSDTSKETSSIVPPSSTLDTSTTGTPNPLDENKINDKTNSTLLTAEELYEKVKNTVVVVYNYQRVSGYTEPVKYGSGSGVVFTSDGYIITNAHVVEDATKLTVLAPDYSDPENTNEYEATLIGKDTYSDLAVLKVEREEPFEYAKLGDSDTVRVGQDICVLGNPKSLMNSLTKGIVSGLGRASIYNSAYGTSTIQIDAAINSGNSGGGLFDMYGNVIGIIDYKLISNTTTTIENIGFAITINDAKPIINDLMTKGYVTNRPGLGINGEAISDYSAYLQGLESGGLYVTYISEDMPVAKSGLQVGDIICKVNGTSVSSISEVQNIIGELNIGDTVELTIYRSVGGRYTTKKINVELGEIELS
ncbi:MAG: S1C family serine protease [Ruminiclostridium sp.]